MTIDRDTSMRVLREGDVPDSLIGAAFGLTRQRVHNILGPPDRDRRRTVPVRPPVDTGEDLPDDLPAFLRGWRARQGLSQAAAARELGVAMMTYAHWEQDAHGCSLPVLLVKYIRLTEKTSTT